MLAAKAGSIDWPRGNHVPFRLDAGDTALPWPQRVIPRFSSS
jgi:hypothetical protein